MTGLSPLELRMQRKATRNFIAADSMLIVLMRAEYVSDGAGGSMRSTPEAVLAQVMRLIPLQDGSASRTTADGEEVSPSYMLMGDHTADVQRWDEFAVGGRRYQVVFVNENTQYEVKAEVAYLGD